MKSPLSIILFYLIAIVVAILAVYLLSAMIMLDFIDPIKYLSHPNPMFRVIFFGGLGFGILIFRIYFDKYYPG